MRSILGATGVPADFGSGTGQGKRPGYNVHGVFNPARPRPDWQLLVSTGVRPLFDNTVTGRYSDPFPILTGARWVPEAVAKGASQQDLIGWNHKQVNA